MSGIEMSPTLEQWQRSFRILASLEFGQISPWTGPTSFDELKLRVETLVVLLGLASRIDLAFLDKIVFHLDQAYSTEGPFDLQVIRTGIRKLLISQFQSIDDDPYLARGVAAVTRRPVGTTNAHDSQKSIDQGDFKSCRFAMRAWYRQLRDADRWKYLRLFGLPDIQLEIDSVFVELHAIEDQDIEPSEDGTADQIRRGFGRIHVDTHTVTDAATMIARTSRFCVIVGDPGSGKSTLTRWIARNVAAGRITDFETAIVVDLASFAFALSESRDLSILEHFFRELGEATVNSAGAATWMRNAASEGASYLLLLDGWDEVPLEFRDAVQQRIDSERVYFTTVITSRPSGFPRRLTTGRHAELYHIAGLGRDGRRDLIERYLDAMQSKQKWHCLVEQIEQKQDLRELASNPFMLGLIVQAFEANGTLRPDEWSLANLYSFATNVMISAAEEKSSKHVVSLSRSVSGLASLSFRLLFEETPSRYLFRRDELIRELRHEDVDAMEASRFIGLVSSVGSRLSFAHATFQEYFAAVHYDAVNDEQLDSAIERAFFSATRSIVLEFVVGMRGRAGERCRANLEHWMERQDRFGTIVRRVAQLLCACPFADRSSVFVNRIVEELWRQAVDSSHLDTKQLSVALAARLNPILLCRTARTAGTKDQFVLDCIVSSVPSSIARTEGIADLMDPAMRERVVTELWGESRAELIESNRQRLISSEDYDELRSAILLAGAACDVGSVAILDRRIRDGKLDDKLQEEIAVSLGQIGTSAATNLLVGMVIGEVPVSRTAVGLARRALQHIEGGHARLNPSGRDRLLRRIACTPTDQPRLIVMLSALNGYPVRNGRHLLQHLAFSVTTPEFARFECLQTLETALSDREFEEVLTHLEDQPPEIETLLLGSAVRRRRRVPVDWLSSRLRDAARMADQQKFLTVALAMSQQRECSGPLDELLKLSSRTALTSEDAKDTNMALALHRALGDFAVDHRYPPDWIDFDVVRNVLENFLSTDPTPTVEQVLLSVSLLARISKPESQELLVKTLNHCRQRLDGTQNTIQNSQLIEIAKCCAQSMAELNPQSLISYPADWEPVNSVLRERASRQGWIVFQDRVLNADGIVIRAPWSRISVHEVDTKQFSAAETRTASKTHLFMSDFMQKIRHAVGAHLGDDKEDAFRDAWSRLKGAEESRHYRRLLSIIMRPMSREQRQRLCWKGGLRGSMAVNAEGQGRHRLCVDAAELKMLLENESIKTQCEELYELMVGKRDFVTSWRDADAASFNCPSCGAVHPIEDMESERIDPPDSCKACGNGMHSTMPEETPKDLLFCITRKDPPLDFLRTPPFGNWSNIKRQRGFCPCDLCKMGQRLGDPKLNAMDSKRSSNRSSKSI